MDRYDADEPPDASAWLELDENDRRALVLRHHHGRVERTLHPAGYRREMHAAMHTVIEDQVARDEPQITAVTVERLCAEGLRRHAAIHAIIEVLVGAFALQRDFEPERWEQALRALTAGSWLGIQMRRDLGAPK